MRTGFRRAVAAAALAVQAVALFAPLTPQVDTGGLPVDKLVHLLLFAVATATVIWAGAPVWPTVVLMIGYAGVSEVIQAALLSQRGGDVRDALADIVGVAIGSLVGVRWAGNSAEEPPETPGFSINSDLNPGR